MSEAICKHCKLPISQLPKGVIDLPVPKKKKEMTPEEQEARRASLKARQAAEDEEIRNHVVDMNARWFVTLDICSIMRVRRATVYAWTNRDVIPGPMKGFRASRWNAQEFLAFLKLWEQEHKSDSIDPLSFRKWMEDGDGKPGR